MRISVAALNGRRTVDPLRAQVIYPGLSSPLTRHRPGLPTHTSASTPTPKGMSRLAHAQAFSIRAGIWGLRPLSAVTVDWTRPLAGAARS